MTDILGQMEVVLFFGVMVITPLVHSGAGHRESQTRQAAPGRDHPASGGLAGCLDHPVVRSRHDFFHDGFRVPGL